MFGRSKPVVFDPYGRRRKRRMPRWLVLLLAGVVLGAGGVWLVQERYLPPRLSASESAQLRNELQQANDERAHLKTQLAEVTQRLAKTEAEKKTQADELSASRGSTERLRADVASLVGALPPDPRSGNVEVRAGRFAMKKGALAYDIVLTRGGSSRPMQGVVQLAVAGTSAKGTAATLNADPITVSMGSHEVLHGSVALPDGFKPKQTTIQVLDRAGGKSLGMRVMLVGE